MAVRRLNYTGRKRLLQSDLRFAIRHAEQEIPTFRADLKLRHQKLPADAQVFVEAYRQTSWMRFRFGTVSDLRPIDDLKLTEFDSAEGILFRVRVTSPTDSKGLILAEADKIRPRGGDQKEDTNRIPLLPVKPDSDIGDEIWLLDFTDHPILLINAAVGDWRSLAKDPVFASLVYPMAFRQILSRILYVEEYFETDDDEDWRSLWLRFATILPGTCDLPGESETDQFDDWIDETVKSFCGEFMIMNRFQNWWTGEPNS